MSFNFGERFLRFLNDFLMVQDGILQPTLSLMVQRAIILVLLVQQRVFQPPLVLMVQKGLLLVLIVQEGIFVSHCPTN